MADELPPRVRMMDCAMWAVIAPKGAAKGGKMLALVPMTPEEESRWTAAAHRYPRDPTPRPDGYFDERDCYRCEPDEGAVLDRWKARQS